jgi:cytochrome P450
MGQTLTDIPQRGLKEVPVFPMARAAGCPLDVSPGLTALQAEGPLAKVRLWDGSTPWLVTRHAYQRALLADPRVSANPVHPGYPHQNEAFREGRADFRTFINMDDPEHARLRRMVTAPFAVKRVDALRPAIQRIVDRLIGELLAGPKPADLVGALAIPTPSLVICQLLGVPYADHDFFQRNSGILIARDTSPEEARTAQGELLGYLNDLIAAKLAAPADDLLSRLAVERIRTGEMSQAELITVSILMLIAGHETTANMIALGTTALLRHPGQLAALRESDDPLLVANAVEELLRYLTITQSGHRRVALADFEIDGHVIHAGDGLIIPTDLANRDESVFADPDRLDIHRDAHEHIAFGFGVHQCLGQQLARAELQIVYGTLFRRIPTLSLAADIEDLPFKHDGVIYGLYELPVTW